VLPSVVGHLNGMVDKWISEDEDETVDVDHLLGVDFMEEVFGDLRGEWAFPERGPLIRFSEPEPYRPPRREVENPLLPNRNVWECHVCGFECFCRNLRE
jgi:hypothetical protein